MTQLHDEPQGIRAHLNAEEAEPAWSMSEVLIVVVALAVSMLLIASVIASLTSPTNTPVPDANHFVLGWTIGLLITGVFVLVRWQRSSEQLRGLQLAASRFPILLGFMVGIAAAITANVMSGLASGSFSTIAPLLGLDAGRIGQVLLGAIFAVLVQPVVESLVFFGVILPRLRATTGPWPGLLSTILLFAGFHGLVYGARLQGNLLIWYGFVWPLLVGFVLAVLRVYAQSTRAVMVAYAGAGSTSILVLLALAGFSNAGAI